MENKIIEFLRKKDFQFKGNLGSGACGKTVLLYDDIIKEQFVCKKYEPFHHQYKKTFFENFKHEIKLLYLINHKNIVRVFNYYIYPEYYTGYILMEFINGEDIESYIIKHPENINEIFLQTVSGFHYLQKRSILHRDIRPLNIMVTDENIVKIIDFGFGKQILEKEGFNKSISLNWWCETPAEFEIGKYDFTTEVYFIGKLFEKIIKEQEIEDFKYKNILNQMCKFSYDERIKSFSDVNKCILSDKFIEIEFSDQEKEEYRSFSRALYNAISEIEHGTKYYEDIEKILQKLEELYKRVMLEEIVPDNSLVISSFVNGGYTYSPREIILVEHIKSFIELLRASSKEKCNIILSNIHTKLDVISRFNQTEPDEDIPF